MKILMVSIASPHFFNWAEQLKNSNHQVYWFDVFDSRTKVEKIEFVTQIVRWRYRFNFPGRYLLKEKAPLLKDLINKFNEKKLNNKFEELLISIEPDVVHSFGMYLTTVPIVEIMEKYRKIKWVFSSWGSDLFYYQNFTKERSDMRDVFPQIDYMFSDCNRDYAIARGNGFKGEFLGVFPGGGGYDLSIASSLMPYKERNTIIIKGYQGKHGRCNIVLEALLLLKEELTPFKIVVFGGDTSVHSFVETSGLNLWPNFRFFGKIKHAEVMRLMGESFLYIGNSLSDGIPNTLLEAIVMGAYPVQSDPGGATSEIICNNKNGTIIRNPEEVMEIKDLISSCIKDLQLLHKGSSYNLKHVRPGLERGEITGKVNQKYNHIENNLNS